MKPLPTPPQQSPSKGPTAVRDRAQTSLPTLRKIDELSRVQRPSTWREEVVDASPV